MERLEASVIREGARGYRSAHKQVATKLRYFRVNNSLRLLFSRVLRRTVRMNLLP
jgi:hypothetical protein